MSVFARCMSIAACAAILGTGTIAAASKPEVNVGNGRVAVKGYDVVAYFTSGRPVKGSSRFTVEWKGAEWHFSTAEHRQAFEAAPDQYAPQFGGYCAWAVSRGYTADVDPNAWRIVAGRLYLNYSRRVQRQWENDIPGNIAKAEAHWPAVLDK